MSYNELGACVNMQNLWFSRVSAPGQFQIMDRRHVKAPLTDQCVIEANLRNWIMTETPTSLPSVKSLTPSTSSEKDQFKVEESVLKLFDFIRYTILPKVFTHPSK